MAGTEITFIDGPQGTPITAASLNALKNDVLNVKTNFGAKGDGITDDTAAIQAALSQSMLTGQVVTFPVGTYIVTNLAIDYSTLSLQNPSGVPYGYPGVRVTGASKRFTIIQQKSGSTGPMLLIQGQVGSNAGAANNNKATGVTIENMELIGTSGSTNHAITLRSLTGCTIQSVNMRGCGGSGVYMMRETFTSGVNDEYFYNVHLKDVRIIACSRYGIECSGQAAISACLTNVGIEACTLGGYYVNPALFTIRGGTVFGCGGPALQTVPNAITNSANFALHVSATRFEGNCSSSGSYDIIIDGCPGYVLDGIIVLSLASTGPHCLGLGMGGTGKANHHGVIVGGYFTGNSSTSGQKWMVTGSDEQNPIVLAPRIDFSGFAGSPTKPADLITGGSTLSFLDPTNIRFSADGYMDFMRKISTPSSPSAGQARQVLRASATDGALEQLVVKFPSGNVSTIAHEGAPSDWDTAAPVAGAHVRGEIVWNSTPSASGNIGWVCVTAGTPGTWKTFGAISA